jgi:hypothetical protein
VAVRPRVEMPDGCLEIPRSSRYRLDNRFLMDALHSGSFDWLRPALNGNDLQHGNLPPSVARIAESWSSLPPYIREAVSALLDVGVASSNATRGAIASSVRTTTENLAWRIAVECREVVQPCLREEEWPDADREFAAIISAALAAHK